MPVKNEALWRGLRGARNGALLIGLGVLVGQLAVGHASRVALLTSLVSAAFAAVVFCLGQVIARGVAGALAGGVAALVLVAACRTDLNPFYYAPPAPAESHPGREMEVTGPSLAGDTFTTRQWRGRVVVVDFWATWCRPCLAELPYLKMLYERYHQDGLEVVGVSFDHSRDSLVEFVKDRSVPWPQIYYEEAGRQGWVNPLARKYDIRGIPANLLLDRQGHAVGYDLHGPELETAVAKLLGKEAPAGAAVGLIVALALACVVGSLGGALVERRICNYQAGKSAAESVATAQDHEPQRHRDTEQTTA